ncbi:hypothetical protein ACHAW5_006765 [Stephanodiscus triporus]|uniref:3-dehydrosphinganine reductase n=1 Tax=Stephanodiscus triporus TaxID=2934178 RepID=A0ABD3NQQ1_9STRA
MTLRHSLRLLAAGILALPALLVLVAVAPVIAILSIPSLAILVRRKRNFISSSFPPRGNNDDQATNDDDARPATTRELDPLLHHAIITGGSSGIGLSIAIELARRGCRHITLLARNEGQLAHAKRSVENAAAASTTEEAVTTTPTRSVRTVSVDVTDFAALEKSIAELVVVAGGGDAKKSDDARADYELPPRPGPPTLLFCCAGYSIPLAFEDLSVSDFRAQVDVNYLGTVHAVKSLLPYMMKTDRAENNIAKAGTGTGGGRGGNIVLTSSMSGQAGTYGYSAYSPTKFALRGFAECLSMELAAKRSNVNISLVYPPDTRTPGYENENRRKPEECRLISESAGVWDPDVIGKGIVDKVLCANPSFDIYFGIDGWMLSMLTSGFNPVTCVLDVICQVALMGLLRFTSLFYLMDFGRITQNCHDTKKVQKGSCKND